VSAGGAAALAALVGVLAGTGDGDPASAGGEALALASEAALAASPAPALQIGDPMPLRAERDLAYWAPVVRPATARAAPSFTAPPVARLATRTPEQSANLVLALGRVTDAGGRVWTRVRLPVLPNNTTGWVPRAALGGLSAVRTRLVVDLERLTATLYRGGRLVFRARVGVGKPQWPTPHGEFYVRSRLTSYRSPFYGPVAFGTSARSTTLTDWPAGGFVGIHGTNRPELLPGRVSHGCIRMRNPDILRLARLLPVGTPLTIL
jgi:lipoprotein-anchoring transpeptidase ErfK/SrfK